MDEAVGLEVNGATFPAFALSLSKGRLSSSTDGAEEGRCFDRLSTNGEGAYLSSRGRGRCFDKLGTNGEEETLSSTRERIA